MIGWRLLSLAAALSAPSRLALAGPPFATDDPEPTDYKHHEIYAFNGGTSTRDGIGGAAGIDFNYGAAPDLQLTVVVPLGFDHPASGSTAIGLGRIELAAKYRFRYEKDTGWDVAVFPRVFLPAGSLGIGELAEHWGVLQDEAGQAESKSGLPMFSDRFPAL